MERVTETYDKRHDLPVQVFNGKEYHLYNGERTCEYCGKTFIANKYSKKRFCSRVCSEKYKHFKGV